MNSCQHCVFREDGEGGEQVGCKAGRLDRYLALGGAAKAPGGHYLVPGRLCAFNARREAVPAGQDLGALRARIRKDVAVRARWVVACGRRQLDPDGLTALALLAAAQAGGHAVEVHVVTRDRKTQRGVSRRLGEGARMPWATVGVSDHERADDPFECLKESMTAHPTDSQFAVLMWGGGGELPPPGLLADLDARVNDDLEQIYYADFPWGCVVSTHVFAALGHSADRPFPDRLEAALRPPGEPFEEFVTPGGGTQ